MKATEANLLKFLKKSPQFVIPIYQRNYSWTVTQCQQLWRDLLHAGANQNISAHFIGSIVYVERGLSTVLSQESLLVIDGQQRLTTCTLLIAALAEYFETNQISQILDTFSARKLRNYYLLNPDEVGERHYKLILSETDKETLLAIVKNAPKPQDLSSRIQQNFELFRSLIEKNSNDIVTICQGLSKLMIVEVSLDRSQDNPQLIFESMNSTGLELSQADLIRNYILMGLEPSTQSDLYRSYWRPMEKAFGQAAYEAHFDPYMRHYLTAKTGEIPNVRDVYASFKQYAISSNLNTKQLVSDIHDYAIYYCAMALGKESDRQLQQAFHDLRELKVDVSYPFLLDIYHDYRQKRLSVEDLLSIVRMVESYVFRRAVCAIPTNSLNKTFAGISRTLNKDRYLESVKAFLLLLPSYRRFPRDEEFQREIKQRDLYNFRSRSYWLRRLENHGRKDRIVVEDYTIEHILPQNEALSEEWQNELGSDWRRIHQTWLHTLGNLTLTAYNSEYSDRPFVYKQQQVTNSQGQKIGFKYSPLKINHEPGTLAKWDEDAIKIRADRLAREAALIWAAPILDSDTLNAYRHTFGATANRYSIEDHPLLKNGRLGELFEVLRNSILELNPCVSEEFLKLYVAYKAETNFVDVIPQSQHLRLSLNMSFNDLEDPKELAEDFTNKGHWGNGDVEVILSSPEELPYVVGLIRQSFERQMHNPGES